MKRMLLKSMILKAKVTQADIRYVGSITIDEDLIEKANLREQENVLIVNRINGNRLQTYIIVGERDSGVICINGAAAHLVNEGDIVDIMAFSWSTGEAQSLFLKLDANNRFSRYATSEEI